MYFFYKKIPKCVLTPFLPKLIKTLTKMHEKNDQQESMAKSQVQRLYSSNCWMYYLIAQILITSVILLYVIFDLEKK